MEKGMQIPNKIGVFNRYKAKKTTMEYGYYYDAVVTLPFAKDKRHVRVWLPGSYDFAAPKKHPVMYMSDGQNLVDLYLTAYGDWHLDRVVRTLGQEGYIEPILVGIDCPKPPRQRSNELNPPYPITKKFRSQETPNHPIANQFIDYIVGTLKPLVDSLFSTDSRKEATAIGGSSMGGIMSFYGFLAYPNDFGFAMPFSPALFFYKKKEIRAMFDEHNPLPSTHARIYLAVGGRKFEKVFVRTTFYARDLLIKRGFDEEHLGFHFERGEIHHEEAWYKYSFDAFRFWLKPLSE